jgi:hypothetical protein
MMGLSPIVPTPSVGGGTPFGQVAGAPVSSAPSDSYESAMQFYNQSLKDAQKTLDLAKKKGTKNQIEAAKIALGSIKDTEEVLKLVASLGGGTSGTGGTGSSSDSSIVSRGASAISNTGKKYINGKLSTDAEWNTFLYGDSKPYSGGTGTGTGTADADAREKRQSAFDLLKLQFDEYGLGALVEPLRGLIQEGISPSEFAVRLRQTEPYKKRFAANAARINKGLRALSEAEYISLEDGYQSIMRNYGLPASYYAKGDLGRQEGFEKLIAGDVSAAELEDRVMTAQNRVINAPPQVKDALKQFYPDINNSEILAYTLDPEKGLADIKRKITAAEIGGAAIGAGLATDVGRAEELAKFGVTAERAREGYQAAVPLIERGRQLSAFYQESPYTQTTAEEELFGLTGAPEASAKRKRLSSLEEAQFSGRTGMTGGALSRDRAGAY